MNEAVTSEETSKSWKRLMDVYDQSLISSAHAQTVTTTTNNNSNVISDPFDCSSLVVDSTFPLVEKNIAEHVQRWNNLDDRKLQQQEDDSVGIERHVRFKQDGIDNDNDNGTNPVPRRKPNGWLLKEDRLQLPKDFDYATTRSSPPPDSDDDDCNGSSSGGGSGRVLCLEGSLMAGGGTLVTKSYHSELWKLFQSIPSYDKLEQQHHAGHKLTHTASFFQQLTTNRSTTLASTSTTATTSTTTSTTTTATTSTSITTHEKNTNTTNGEQQTTRNEGNSLHSVMSVFRISDRHGYPPPPVDTTTATTASFDSGLVTTLWFECWKLGTVPSSSLIVSSYISPDENRMVLEFWDQCTLLDVHNTICQMMEDVQWDILAKSSSAEVTSNKQQTTNEKDDNIDDDDNDTNRMEIDNTDRHETNKSGCFIIGNSCYTTGSVDYCQGILDWMSGGNSSTNTVRAQYLGLFSSPDEMNIQNMKDVKLCQIPFQLGVRYFHCCHGNVETSLFLIDRRLTPKATMYPIIHDTWIPAQWKTVPFCDVCQTQKVFYVTSTECVTTDGGPKMLCEKCCNDLKLLEREPSHVTLFSTWTGLGS